MKKEKTDIDKTIIKINKLLDKHKYQNERLELCKITNKAFNLYLVGRFTTEKNNIYEQKHIATITLQ